MVDDEPLLLELASTLLVPAGYDVKTFRDAESALNAFTQANPRPAVVITDYAMHRMNGLGLLKECRQIEPRQKVIMVSGTVDQTIFADSQVKPDHFLAKPYLGRRFVNLVDSVFNEV